MDKKYYNDFFNKFGPDVHSDPVRFSEIAKLCRGSVLDVACGTGTLADFYKGSYTGTDFSDVAIDSARNIRRKSAAFNVADFTQPFEGYIPPFETIVLAEFLEHIENDKIVFENVSKLLMHNGRIIISVPNCDRVPDESHVRTFSIPELRARFRPLGRVKFYNWAGASERVLMTIDVGQRNDDLLTLCIFAKNEEKGLETAVLSCIDFVDEIAIIVDSKSTDKTLSLAKMYADKWQGFDWQNSFCKARNEVQALATYPWILALDGHEFVSNSANIKDFLLTDKDSFLVKITLENNFSFLFPRVLRKEVLWDQDVHNRPLTKKSVSFDSFLIKHDRDNLQSKESTEARNVQRDKMVNDIMNEKLKKNKGDIRAWFYLGQQNHINKNFKKAIYCYKKYLKYSTNKQERWLAYYYIATLQLLMKKYLRCYFTLYKANSEIPDRWEVCKMLGVIHMMIGKFEKGAEFFVESLGISNGHFLYHPELRDDAQTWDFIGLCFQGMKKYDEARRAWKESLKLEKKTENRAILDSRLKILERMTE